MVNPRLFGALALATLLLIGPSPAHQSWISEEGAKNPVTGSWCCGVHDCGIVMPAPIATDAGWAIHGDVIIDVNGRRVRVDEVVPYNEAIASPDGHFWRCQASKSHSLARSTRRMQTASADDFSPRRNRSELLTREAKHETVRSIGGRVVIAD
jgi:hypothetical protein